MMAGYQVTNIVDGSTFDVAPNWDWQGQSGRRVSIANHTTPELSAVGGESAKEKLKNLILGKPVELKNRVNTGSEKVSCDVYLAGDNIVKNLSS
jgi:endonuclease YncB( thermonuclease family)